MFRENRYILYTIITLVILISGNMSAGVLGGSEYNQLNIRDSINTDSTFSDTAAIISDTAMHMSDTSAAATDTSLTDRMTADSLFNAIAGKSGMTDSTGRDTTVTDTLLRDSLFRDSIGLDTLNKDSIKVLTEKELKKLRKDSIRREKARAKMIRDSIRWAKPRILDTYAVPDSMHYKRILVWNVNDMVNDVHLTNLDTTYTEWISEYPFLKKDINATYLGTIGSAAQSYNFFKREEQEDFYAFTPYNIYSYTPETVPLYNTKAPYTELAYWGTIFAFQEKEELNLRFLHTQNVTPELNFSIMYEKFGSNGFLSNEETDSRSTVVTTNYLGDRYIMNAGYIRHDIKRQENGGMTDTKWMKDTLVDAKTIPIHLTDANNRYIKNTAFLKHSYAFPIEFKKLRKNKDISISDSTEVSEVTKDSLNTATQTADMRQEAGRQAKGQQAADTSKTAEKQKVRINDVTAIHIGHMFEFSEYSKKYTDNIAQNDEVGRAFYHDMFNINPVSSNDSISLRTIDNKFYVRLQPWVTNALLSKIDVGVGYQWVNAYSFDPSMYITGNRNKDMHNAYVYGGTGGNFRKYIDWDVYADYYFLGYKQNDFSINANARFSFFPFKDKNKGIHLDARFKTTLKRPDYFADHYYTNHYIWSNNFGKVSRTNIEGELRIPSWGFSAFVGYSLMNNYIYYDNQGFIRQDNGIINVLSAYLREDIKFWYIHLDNQILFQMSSNQKALPLPMLSVRLRYYFEFVVVKNALKMQLGIDGSYNTAYYAPAYNPAIGVFQTQDIEKTGNCPYMDLFMNLQWKGVNVFLKCTNVAQGWPTGDYSSAYQYMMPKRGFKFGIHWPFIIR